MLFPVLHRKRLALLGPLISARCSLNLFRLTHLTGHQRLPSIPPLPANPPAPLSHLPLPPPLPSPLHRRNPRLTVSRRRTRGVEGKRKRMNPLLASLPPPSLPKRRVRLPVVRAAPSTSPFSFTHVKYLADHQESLPLHLPPAPSSALMPESQMRWWTGRSTRMIPGIMAHLLCSITALRR